MPSERNAAPHRTPRSRRPGPTVPATNGDEPDPAYRIPASIGRVKDLPAAQRPREALERLGAGSLSDDQLLAILLRTGKPGLNAMDLARALLHRYETLGRLAASDWRELQAQHIPGLGPVKAMELSAALEIGRRIAIEQSVGEARPQVCEPAAAARLLAPLLRGCVQEIFWVLLLDIKNRLLGHPLEITRGILDASLVHPREVFSAAIRQRAAAVILAHNHPSGDPDPSAEDLRVTRQLVASGKILDLRVLDHVILGRATGGRPGFLSLREQGLVTFD